MHVQETLSTKTAKGKEQCLNKFSSLINLFDEMIVEINLELLTLITIIERRFLITKVYKKKLSV